MLNNRIKICVTSQGEKLTDSVDPRFGRCVFFIFAEIVDGKMENIKAVKNGGVKRSSGAGITAATQLGNEGVKILFTGNVGPKAADVLMQLGIEVIKVSGAIKDVVESYLSGDSTVTQEREIASNKLEKNKINVDEKCKVLVPLMDNNGDNSLVSLHFGHAPYLGVYDADSKEIIIKENRLDHINPNKTPVDQVFEEINPTIVFVQDIGARAIDLFLQKGIKIQTGPYKTLKEVVGNIKNFVDLSEGCKH